MLKNIFKERKGLIHKINKACVFPHGAHPALWHRLAVARGVSAQLDLCLFLPVGLSGKQETQTQNVFINLIFFFKSDCYRKMLTQIIGQMPPIMSRDDNQSTCNIDWSGYSMITSMLCHLTVCFCSRKIRLMSDAASSTQSRLPAPSSQSAFTYILVLGGHCVNC